MPTAAEAGLPDFQIQGWYALFAPKNTPAPIIARLNEALRKGVTNADYQKKLGRARLVCRAGRRDHARVT